MPREDVMYTFVKKQGKTITDLISFYNLPSHALKIKGEMLKAAYSFY
jgi:hypothetical protein